MDNFREKDYKIFDLFDKDWAIVTSGNSDNYNSCTIGWGSFGNIWQKSGNTRAVITIYVHPDRYTSKFLKENDTFTVSFFDDNYKKAIAYIGSHSGRDEKDKEKNAGLTPTTIGDSITYKEANLTFLCKKLYQHQILKEDLSNEIKEYYASNPKVYPDGKGGWMPHIMFIGEIIDYIDKR